MKEISLFYIEAPIKGIRSNKGSSRSMGITSTTVHSGFQGLVVSCGRFRVLSVRLFLSPRFVHCSYIRSV
jgi:hypothetical protein